ncbi:hypothetical protein [Brevibacterium album]|uniref:hypothetical protein n=1 Tax=Brevibacterium album TaxID=417948 RepID=UPI00041B9FC1|nr:hypothetical protein [Brevibacterium album]
MSAPQTGTGPHQAHSALRPEERRASTGPARALRRALPAALTAAALLALAACSGDEPAEAEPEAPAETTSAPAPEPTPEHPAAITRDSNVNVGSGSFGSFPACMHAGPVSFTGGEATIDPSAPSEELADTGAQVRIRLTDAPDYVEIGPDGRAYASVSFRCDAVGGDAPEGDAARIDSGHIIVGGTEDALTVVGLVTAGALVDEGQADGSGAAAGGAQTDAAAAEGPEAASAAPVPLRAPAGQGEAFLHSSLRNGDGYRYFLRPEQDGDEAGEPSGREWATFDWDPEAGAVVQLERSEDILDTVPRPEETVVVGADGDRAVLTGQEDLAPQEAFETLTERLGEPDDEETTTVSDTDYAGYEQRTRTWGSFSASLVTPPEGTDWATCLAWEAELGDIPPEITLDSPLRWGTSLTDMGFSDSAVREDIGETAAVVDDDGDRYVTETMNSTPVDGMITIIGSGTGCRDTPDA